MSKFKKTPLYESSTSTSPYEFEDYTSPAAGPQGTASPAAPSQLDSLLKRKIETVYKSQMLDIEEENEEHQQVE